MSRRFLFVLGSHRGDANTESLARRAAAQLPADSEQERISLANNRAAYMRMNLGGVLRGNGTAQGDVLNDTEALTRATPFFALDAPPARFPGRCTRPASATKSVA